MGDRRLTLPFLLPRRYKGMGEQRHNPTTLSPVHTEQEAGWTSGPVWTGAENVAPVRPKRVAIPTEVSRSEPPCCFRHTTYCRISEKFGSTCLSHLYRCNLVHIPCGPRPLSYCFSFAGQVKRLEGRNVAIRTKGSTSVG